jgi:hypothetical protein
MALFNRFLFDQRPAPAWSRSEFKLPENERLAMADSARVSFQAWLAHQRACVAGRHRANWRRGTIYYTPNITRRQAFVKREKLLKRVGDRVLDFDPRVIMATSVHNNALLGPYIYALQEAFRAVWSPDTDTFFSCGYTNVVVGEYVHRAFDDGFCFAFVLDKSRFDQCITTRALEVEFQIYESILKPTTRARQMLYAQLNTIGYTPQGCRFECPGRRKSGDPNTSLGNTLLCVLAARHTLDSLHMHARIMALGDDMVVFARTNCFQDFVDHQSAFGFATKGYVTSEPVDIVYMSSHPLPATFNGQQVWAMTPLLAKTLVKFCYSHSYVAIRKPAEVLRGMCRSLLSTAGHNEPLCMFLNRILSALGQGAAIAPSIDHLKPILYEVVSPGAHALEWLYTRYPDLNEIMVEATSWTTIPCRLRGDTLAVALAKDVGLECLPKFS